MDWNFCWLFVAHLLSHRDHCGSGAVEAPALACGHGNEHVSVHKLSDRLTDWLWWHSSSSSSSSSSSTVVVVVVVVVVVL